MERLWEPRAHKLLLHGQQRDLRENNTESQTKDIAFDARQFTERGVDVGGSATATVKKLAGFSVGGSASLGWKKSTSQSLSAANNSSASTAATITSKTDTSDSLMFYKADFHIWRYPVIAPAPTGLFGAAINGTISGTEDGTQYFTYTMSDEPTRVQGDAGQSSQFDDYNPIHEEGNLFSYPTTIESTPATRTNRRTFRSRLRRRLAAITRRSSSSPSR